jgi:hypothetical protein
MDHGTRIRWLLGRPYDTSIGSTEFCKICLFCGSFDFDLICDMAQSAMLVAHEHRAIRLSLVFGYQTVAFRQMVMGKNRLFPIGVFDISEEIGGGE